MKILRIIFLFPLAVIRLFMVLFISYYFVLVGLWKRKRHGYSRELQKWAMQRWGTCVLWAMGVKAEIKRQPEPDQFILMPNHRSYIDIPLVIKYNQGTLIGKAELRKWPMAKSAIKITNPILVNRSELKSLVETMKKIKESVEKNIPVILFPEGTTYVGPLTKPFKNGSFKIAGDSRIPVIPVAIHYSDPDDAWIDDDTFFGHFLRQMGKPRTRVIMHYGTPIINSDYSVLKKQTKEQIEKMLKEILIPRLS